MKKIMSIVLVVFSLFLPLSGVNAEESTVWEVKEEENIFQKFLLNSEGNDLEVADSEGEVVEGEVANEIKKYLKAESYDEVLELLESNSLSLMYSTETEIRNIESDLITIQDIGSTVRRTYHFYHLKSDKTTGKHKKEWSTELSVSYRENSNGTLTALSNPTMNIQANFGSAYNISTSNYTTGYSYTSNKKGIVFSGSYKLQARLVLPITIGGFEFPIGRNFDWGTIKVSKTQK